MTGHIDPTRAQFDAFKALDRDEPCEMLNLVRLRDIAQYPQGHEQAGSPLTGAEAYRLYGKHSGPILARVGGRLSGAASIAPHSRGQRAITGITSLLPATPPRTPFWPWSRTRTISAPSSTGRPPCRICA